MITVVHTLPHLGCKLGQLALMNSYGRVHRFLGTYTNNGLKSTQR